MRLHTRPAVIVAVVLVAFVDGGALHASPTEELRVPDDVRSVSYFPALGGWTLMWTRFDADAVDRDFARIAWLHANTVRVIVPTHVFGYPSPDAVMTERLEEVVGLAARHGLRVELTLFDWWHDYSDIAGSRSWAGAVLTPYAGDDRIAFVELQNEIRPQDAGAPEWAAALIPYVRGVVRRPVAVSVPALDPARDLQLLHAALGPAQPDLYSAHFYWRPEFAADSLERARDAVAPLPLRVGETGYSTAVPYEVVPGVPASASAREAEQGYYLRSLAMVARRVGLPSISPWILSDFAPGAIPADDPAVSSNAREYSFGLFRVSGAAKPAATDLRRIFSGANVDGFNGGFEDAVRDETGRAVPALWRVRRTANAAFARDVRVARTGRASGRIDGVPAGTGPDAAFVIAPPDPAVRSGDRSTLTAFAQATTTCGDVRLAIRWFSRDGHAVGGAQSESVPCGTRGWRRLRVTGVAPAGATYVGLYLRAAGTAGHAWFDDVSYACARVGVPASASPARSARS